MHMLVIFAAGLVLLTSLVLIYFGIDGIRNPEDKEDYITSIVGTIYSSASLLVSGVYLAGVL